IGGSILVVILCAAVYRLLSSLYGDAGGTGSYVVVPDRRIRNATVENFLLEIAHEKPIRFSPRQLKGFTRNYSTRLGAGGFGAVFRGVLPNGLPVAVSRLFGFCFDHTLRALVYEFMEHGALDAFLLGDRGGRDVVVAALRDVAVGVARGIRYLHEECQQKIVHYDIKPGNVLLDANLTPKVADFGLARLVNRADTHAVPESQQWLPRLAWEKYETGELMDIVSAEGGGEHERDEEKEIVERMCKVAFWCVQQQPEARPPMSVVVKMLEGEMEIAPPVNPFQHLMAAPPLTFNLWTTTATSAPANIPLASGVSEGSNRIVSL
ncbi:unnamed protein product, partial [Urochloa decumbens]